MWQSLVEMWPAAHTHGPSSRVVPDLTESTRTHRRASRAVIRTPGPCQTPGTDIRPACALHLPLPSFTPSFKFAGGLPSPSNVTPCCTSILATPSDRCWLPAPTLGCGPLCEKVPALSSFPQFQGARPSMIRKHIRLEP